MIMASYSLILEIRFKALSCNKDYELYKWSLKYSFKPCIYELNNA